MNRTLLLAVVALLFAGCQKEYIAPNGESSGVANGITTISASIDPEAGTRISLDYSYDDDTDSETDVVTWKDDDKLRFFELVKITDGEGNITGYQVGSKTTIDFVLSQGSGTKSGVFSATDELMPLDPQKIYAVTHAGRIDRFANSIGGTPSVNCIKFRSFVEGSTYIITENELIANNKAWAENNVLLWGVLRFEDSKPLPVEFNVFSSMFEIIIGTKVSVPKFELKTLKFSITKGPSAYSKNMIAYHQSVIFDSNFKMVEKATTAQPTMTITFPAGHEISSESPLKFNLPLCFRYNGYYDFAAYPSREINIEVTSTAGKTYKIVKTKAHSSLYKALFQGGTTYVLTLYVDTDLT